VKKCTRNVKCGSVLGGSVTVLCSWSSTGGNGIRQSWKTSGNQKYVKERGDTIVLECEKRSLGVIGELRFGCLGKCQTLRFNCVRKQGQFTTRVSTSRGEDVCQFLRKEVDNSPLRSPLRGGLCNCRGSEGKFADHLV